jgi:hypothetical protein
METLSFVEFLEELAQQEIALAPGEVRRMRESFGDKTLQMGHLQADGSMSIPVDCILESVQSLGSQKLSEAVEALKGGQMASMLESVEALVDRVGDARKRKLARIVAEFQTEPDRANAHAQWKDIEKTIFGVDFPG